MGCFQGVQRSVDMHWGLEPCCWASLEKWWVHLFPEWTDLPSLQAFDNPLWKLHFCSQRAITNHSSQPAQPMLHGKCRKCLPWTVFSLWKATLWVSRCAGHPLVSCRSRWCAGEGQLFSYGVGPSGGVCWALLCSSSSCHHPQWDGTGEMLLHSTAPKHIPVNTLHRHPWAPWDVGMDVGQGGLQKPLSWAGLSGLGKVARDKYLQTLQNCPGFLALLR